MIFATFAHAQDAQVLFSGEDFERAVFVIGRDDHFKEGLGHHACGLGSQPPVDGDDAAEGRHRVGRPRALKGFADARRRRRAARVGMLDDGAAGRLELAHQRPGCVHIDEVVE